MNKTDSARRMPDGLYYYQNGLKVFIKEGILYVPVAVLNPVIVFTTEHPLHWVEDHQGRRWNFMRAAHVIEEIPETAEKIKALAARYGSDL